MITINRTDLWEGMEVLIKYTNPINEHCKWIKSIITREQIKDIDLHDVRLITEQNSNK